MIAQFFEKCRPEFYFHGARLAKDKETGRQVWRLNLWLKLEAENSAALHGFVKDYAFQRLWAEFAPTQITMSIEVKPGKQKT